jgi:hypothetical protein
MVPTFTTESIDEGGARLDPDSIATPTPQFFDVASPPDRQPGFGVDPPIAALDTQRRGSRAAHRPISVRFEPALELRGFRQRFLTYAFSSLLAGPEPSDSADPSRTLSGLLPPSRAFPRSGCPQLHQPAATDQQRSPLTSARFHSASWRTVGFQNSAIASDQRFQAAQSYSLIRPPGTGPRRIRRCPKRRDGRFWTWWAQLQRSMGPPCVVVRHILGKHPGEGVARRRSACGR